MSSDFKPTTEQSGTEGKRKSTPRRAQNHNHPIKGLPKSIESHLATVFERYLRFREANKDNQDKLDEEFVIMDLNWKQWLKRNQHIYTYEKYEYLFALRVHKFYPDAVLKAIEWHERKTQQQTSAVPDDFKGIISTLESDASNSIEPTVEERLNRMGLVRG